MAMAVLIYSDIKEMDMFVVSQHEADSLCTFSGEKQ